MNLYNDAEKCKKFENFSRTLLDNPCESGMN